jgi:hypothetical protein
MASTLYEEIFEKAEARGFEKGFEKGEARVAQPIEQGGEPSTTRRRSGERRRVERTMPDHAARKQWLAEHGQETADV